MTTPTLGDKQTCPECRARFYDLGRRPAKCPKCSNSFFPQEDHHEARSSRRTRAESQGESEDSPTDHPAVAEADEPEEVEGPDLMDDDAVMSGGSLAVDGDDEAPPPKFDERALGDSEIDDTDDQDSDMAGDSLDDIADDAIDEDRA